MKLDPIAALEIAATSPIGTPASSSTRPEVSDMSLFPSIARGSGHRLACKDCGQVFRAMNSLIASPRAAPIWWRVGPPRLAELVADRPARGSAAGRGERRNDALDRRRLRIVGGE